MCRPINLIKLAFTYASFTPEDEDVKNALNELLLKLDEDLDENVYLPGDAVREISDELFEILESGEEEKKNEAEEKKEETGVESDDDDDEDEPDFDDGEEDTK